MSLVDSAPSPVGGLITDGDPPPDRCNLVWRRFCQRTPRVVLFPHSAFPNARYGDVFEVVEGRDVDAILLTNERQSFALERFRSARDLFLVPVINVTGRSSPVADVDFDLKHPRSWIETASCIRRFAERRSRLPFRFLSPASPAVRLLAYLFVSGSDLTPVPQPDSAYYFAYKGFSDTRTTTLVAEALANKGWLERRFFDRFHKCAACGSHRMTVREECPTCRSPDLSETDLIHHYSCAYLGPDADFRSASALVCPKCSKQLRHYGKDYDKPGQAQICGQCGDATSEPPIGFVCQDCRTHVDGDAVATTDVFSYALSNQADVLFAPDHADVARVPAALTLHLPAELQREILRLSMRKDGSPDFAVAEVRYGAHNRLSLSRGEAAFASMRRTFLDNLLGLLGHEASLYTSDDCDYLLFPVFGDGNLGGSTQGLLERAEAVLCERLQPSLSILWRAPEEAGR